MEAVTQNWDEIFDEKIFQLLLKKITKWAVAKLGQQFGVKSVGGVAAPAPRDLDVSIEIDKRKDGGTPYESLKMLSNPTELTPEEEDAFLNELKKDPDFEKELTAILVGIAPIHEKKIIGRKVIVPSHRVSAKSLMSPVVLEELKAEQKDEQKDEGEKGLFSSASF